MNAADANMPRSIKEYLDSLRAALEGADPALIQDALSDAETHLRAECAARPGETEQAVLQSIAQSYGSPADVAAAYLEIDRTVQAALAPSPRSSASRPPSTPQGAVKRFFGVYGDPRSWTSLMLLLISLFTGIFYFTIAVLGLSLSLGLSILIIGIPFFIGFIGVSRLLGHVEGRLVEAMTGERMPRRSPAANTSGWLDRLKNIFGDLRTWTTIAYQLLALPLGVIYFSVTVTGLAMGLGLIGPGILIMLRSLALDLGLDPDLNIQIWGASPEPTSIEATLLSIATIVFGVLFLTATLHLARWLGRMHGRLAKRLLVSAAA